MELASFNINNSGSWQQLQASQDLKDKIGKINIDDIQPIQDVKNIKESELPGYEKAARGFEGIFLNMLYKEMKSGLDENAFSKENKQLYSFGDKTLGGYIDMMFTEQMSNSGKGIGIAEMIYKQLTGRELPHKSQRYTPLTEQVPASFNINRLKEEVDSASSIIDNMAQSPGDSKNSGAYGNEELINRLRGFDKSINKNAEKYGLDQNLIKSVIAAESSGRYNAVSKAGAKGLMQLTDPTAKDMGVTNPFDADQNIEGGSKYLSTMLEKYEGNLDLALAAYNAGPGNVDKYGGVPPFKETENYIARVKNYLDDFTNLG